MRNDHLGHWFAAAAVVLVLAAFGLGIVIGRLL